MDNKLEGRRRIGRLRLRWVEDVGKDLRKMKIKRLGEKNGRMYLRRPGSQRAVQPK